MEEEVLFLLPSFGSHLLHSRSQCHPACQVILLIFIPRHGSSLHAATIVHKQFADQEVLEKKPSGSPAVTPAPNHGSVPVYLCSLSPSTHTSTLGGGYDCLHFTNDKTGTQRRQHVSQGHTDVKIA